MTSLCPTAPCALVFVQMFSLLAEWDRRRWTFTTLDQGLSSFPERGDPRFSAHLGLPPPKGRAALCFKNFLTSHGRTFPKNNEKNNNQNKNRLTTTTASHEVDFDEGHRRPQPTRSEHE